MASIELARHDRSIPLQAKAIAKQQGIPARFIEQILQGLKQAGIVRSLRGAQGGYTLAQDPGQISLAELVNSMNGNEALPSTATSSTGPIGNQGASSPILSTIWAQVQEAETSRSSSDFTPIIGRAAGKARIPAQLDVSYLVPLLIKRFTISPNAPNIMIRTKLEASEYYLPFGERP